MTQETIPLERMLALEEASLAWQQHPTESAQAQYETAMQWFYENTLMSHEQKKVLQMRYIFLLEHYTVPKGSYEHWRHD